MSDVYDKTHKLIIAGSGPAGLTAALYAARADLEPIVFEGKFDQPLNFTPGGQLMQTTEVENYPGFPDGITGPELIAVMKKQAERFGAVFIEKHVEGLTVDKRPFTLAIEGGKTASAQTVILSTGANARWLGIESESKLRLGGGVSACATCDGALFRNKIVHVVGGGDTAMEEATFLTRYASRVFIVHRRDTLRASKIMQQRALANEKIGVVWNAAVEEVLGADGGRITGLRLRDTTTDEIRDVESQGLFIAIGHKPNSEFLRGKVDLDENGFVLVKHPTSATSIDGIFACGDLMDPSYRQAVTAAGTGCKAAIDAERWLTEHDDASKGRQKA
jgi:thioredoxin reductase (NADPH)